MDSPVPRAAAGRPFLGPSPLGLRTLPSLTRSLRVRAAPSYPSQHGGRRNWRAGTVLSPCTCSGLIRKHSGGFISLLEARVEDGLPLGEPIFARPVPRPWVQGSVCDHRAGPAHPWGSRRPQVPGPRPGAPAQPLRQVVSGLLSRVCGHNLPQAQPCSVAPLGSECGRAAGWTGRAKALSRGPKGTGCLPPVAWALQDKRESCRVSRLLRGARETRSFVLKYPPGYRPGVLTKWPGEGDDLSHRGAEGRGLAQSRASHGGESGRPAHRDPGNPRNWWSRVTFLGAPVTGLLPSPTARWPRGLHALSSRGLTLRFRVCEEGVAFNPVSLCSVHGVFLLGPKSKALPGG